MARKRKNQSRQVEDAPVAGFDGVGSRTTWRAFDAGTAMAAGILAPRVTQTVWRAFTGRTAPKNVRAQGVSTAEALVWAALAGALTQVIRTVAARATSKYWERSTGETPPKMSVVDPLRGK